MTNPNKQPQQFPPRWHADRSVWLIWLGMILLAVAIFPFAVRNSEVVRQIAAMCGYTSG